MDPNKNQINLDDAIGAMKQTGPTAEQSRSSTSRVLASLQSEPASIVPDRIRNESDFSTLLQPYLRGELTDAQKMLVEDRLASNPAYRRQLDQLRGNVREMAPARRPRSTSSTVIPWAIAAGLLITTGYFTMDSIDRLMAPVGPRAEIASVSGNIFKVSAAGLESVTPGATLKDGEAVRTAKGSSAVVRLPDGSLIEMNERAELSIFAAYSGSTVKLERGNIVVQAAKQKRGALKVATRESTVSVKGTIFSVSAGLRGTQVAVVEGHVVVDQGGKSEDLLPGQITGSQASLKRTSVPEQIAWSKDFTKYMAMLGELSKISRQIESLPFPSLRNSSNLLAHLPADTVVYAAIPNISGTVADATRIFEDRLKQSPALQEWWKTDEVAQIRDLAEKLRAAGSQIGDEIVIAASLNESKSLGSPILLAEVKGAGSRAALETQVRQFTGNTKLDGHLSITDSLLVVGENTSMSGGFENSALGETVKKSYAKGAGWILAADLEQIFTTSVNKVSNVKSQQAMTLTGINKLRHLVVERRDIAGRSNTSAAVSFTAPRSGIASWLAEPAPMPSLDYISPDAHFAFSAVTKDASQMASEFFAAMGGAATQVSAIEKELGINVLNDLIGPLGGEITMAVDGALLPVPTYVFSTEVYNASLLTSTLRRVADAFNLKTAGTKMGSVTFSQESASGRTWYSLKHSAAPVEIHFTYDGGYMVAAQSRDTILKALQHRASLLSLSRSQRFHDLLPVDSQVNASAIFYVNIGSTLESAAAAVKGAMNLPDTQKQALDQFTANSGPVLITAYAGADSITFASSSGFFGFGIDSLLAAGKGAPILPQVLARAFRGAGIMNTQKVQ